MNHSPQLDGHSADVRMSLAVNGQSLRIAQLGPHFLILSDSVDHPPADAEIQMSVDGHESRWSVFLADGISQSKSRVVIVQPSSRTTQNAADQIAEPVLSLSDR